MAGGIAGGVAGRPPSKLGVAALLIIVVLLVRGLRVTPDAPATATTVAPQVAVDTARPSTPSIADPMPVVMTLGQTVRQAKADAERAIGALGGAGARLYSENCYAALQRKPSDAARDRCLAFDQIAQRLLSRAGDLSEATWFDEAATRARYIQSSTLPVDGIEAAIAKVSAATGAIEPSPTARQDALSTDEPANALSAGNVASDDEVQGDATDAAAQEVAPASLTTDPSEPR